MARKTLTWTVDDKNRDEGKLFHIMELSATETEEWAVQAFLALSNAGIEIPEDVAAMGFAGIAKVGLAALGKVPYEHVKPLMDKMMGCVKIIPDASQMSVMRQLIESDIEEMTTRMKLRKMIFGLHADFFMTAMK
jgi:hypothetical protein